MPSESIVLKEGDGKGQIVVCRKICKKEDREDSYLGPVIVSYCHNNAAP